MQFRPQELSSHLKSETAPVYLLHGAEQLLVEDSANMIRQSLKYQGYDERIIFTMETGFDWPRFSGEFDSLSLFSQKKLIELRLPTGKPGVKGAEILAEIAANPAADLVLLIVCGKFEAGIKNTKWVKQISQSGVVIEHYSVAANQLLGWISQRARFYKLTINNDASRLLAYYLEGNLLAIDQELKKFALLSNDKSITIELIQHSVEDSARFSIYGLVDSAIAGNLKRSLRMLASLKSEGTEPVLINWALARETRSLLEMSCDLSQGKSVSAVLKQHRVWNNRAGLVESALKRLKLSDWELVHQHICVLDRMIKGRTFGVVKADIWTEYERIIATLCGVNNYRETYAC